MPDEFIIVFGLAKKISFYTKPGGEMGGWLL